MSFNRLRRTTTVLATSALFMSSLTIGVALSSSSSVAASAPTPGVTAKQITIGATVPLSGLAKGYAEVSAAADAVFSYVNSKGGVNGRKINYVRLDDCYNIPALGCTNLVSATPTLTETQALVTQDNVFATVGSLGTAAQDSVLKYLKLNGVPQLFVNSGSTDWDNANYPNTFGFQTSYNAEGKMFAKYINAHFAGQIVGTIGQGDDFGANGLAGLQAGGLDIPANLALTYAPSDAATGSTSDIAVDVTALKAAGAQVVVLNTIPPFTNAVLLMAKAMNFSPQWFISSVGSDPIAVANASEVGAITDTPYSPANANTPWNNWIKKVIGKYADEATAFPHYVTGANAGILNGNMVYGAAWAVAFVEALQSLGKNVTRAGIVKSLMTTKFQMPSLLPFGYSATNHQGFTGGSLATVVANPSGTPQLVALVGNAEYSTGAGSNSPIVTLKQAQQPIPTWLK